MFLNHINPDRSLQGSNSQPIPSAYLTKFNEFIPKKNEVISLMENQCNATTDPNDLFELLQITCDKF